MAELSLKEIATKIKGEIIQGSPEMSFHEFNIDSRLTMPGELFFALIANRNGHDYIDSAIKKGAHGAVVSQKVSIPQKNIAIIKVKDTQIALQELAKQVLKEHDLKIVGITGSTGKTTTKEFISSILEKKYKVLKSEGNLNNMLGLPLSILKIEKQHKIAVLEMAMSSPGEIQRLTQIAPPDISVITNIAPVHLQFFKDIEQIAEAKKEILYGTKSEGIAVLNGDDPLVNKIAQYWKGNKFYFGLSEECNVQASHIISSWDGMSFELISGNKKHKAHTSFFYRHYLYNLLAAAGTALVLSIPIGDIVNECNHLSPLKGRGKLIRLKTNIKVIDESYNSNPSALKEALNNLTELYSKRKIAVLGDMLELGKREKTFHIQAGQYLARLKWDILITVGPLGKFIAKGALSSGMNKNNVASFADPEEAGNRLLHILKEGDLVLVKGSRGVKTDTIIEQLKKERL
ncbi:MAG: UDP-N-acetylmuramoyl-tripeptide--D-alanyl-D-alanine ligase [Candidatus Aminicenantaceae bacterium]